MNERETVDLIVRLLEEQTPFVHYRFGDGDVFFATGTGPVITADGEEWAPELARGLLAAWAAIGDAPVELLLGDLETYAVSDGCELQWRLLLAELRPRRQYGLTELVHMEALRAGFGHALPAYLAVRDDPRRKAYAAPQRLEPLARALGCVHVPVPLRTAHAAAGEILAGVKATGAEVVLFSAGRGGKLVQAALAHERPAVTQLDVGSGLDLLIPDGVRRGTDLAVDRAVVLADYRRAGLV